MREQNFSCLQAAWLPKMLSLVCWRQDFTHNMSICCHYLAHKKWCLAKGFYDITKIEIQAYLKSEIESIKCRILRRLWMALNGCLFQKVIWGSLWTFGRKGLGSGAMYPCTWGLLWESGAVSKEMCGQGLLAAQVRMAGKAVHWEQEGGQQGICNVTVCAEGWLWQKEGIMGRIYTRT